ncbi:hypothetical protein NPIL_613401 [Nephila pilipes]|uniref:Endonuclease/exonuclease/phosphatase domain-containing protein n=1 Tax=Nephila pilipes TaxID=299642 RepID=A0A8X6TLL5_NEPPI|nr:hypothetical protein NPIL_613401 [Nephila pilipes]
MGTNYDKSEVVHLDVWKNGVLFKILAIYSPPCNSPDFSYVNHGNHTIFVGDFNAHSPFGVTLIQMKPEGKFRIFLTRIPSNMYITKKFLHLSTLQWQKLYPGSIDGHC